MSTTEATPRTATQQPEMATPTSHLRLTGVVLIVLAMMAMGLSVLVLVIAPGWSVTFWSSLVIAVSCASLLVFGGHGKPRTSGVLVFFAVSLAVALDSLNPSRSLGLAAPVVPLLVVYLAFAYTSKSLNWSVAFSLGWLLMVVLLKRLLYPALSAETYQLLIVDAAAYALFILSTAIVVRLVERWIRVERERADRSDAALESRNMELASETRSRQRAEREEQLRSAELSRLLDIAKSFSATLDLDTLLGLILKSLREVIHYDDAYLLEGFTDGTNVGRVVSVGGNAQARLRGSEWHADSAEGLAVLDSLRNGQTQLFSNLATHDAHTQAFGAWITQCLGPSRHIPGRVSSLLTPLRSNGRTIGLLLLFNNHGNPFTRQTAHLVSAFATHAAIALNNVQLHQAQVREARLRERTRLAHELHDSVSQSLFSIVLGTRTAMARPDDQALVKQALDYVVPLAESALIEMRALIFELKPNQLQEDGLLTSLKRQLDALCSRNAVALDFVTLGGEPGISLDAKEAAYRITIEAATNAIKHSRLTRLTVTVQTQPTDCVVTITDNGCGFDPSQVFTGHLGLEGMYARARQQSGELSVRSRPGEGSTVMLTMQSGR
jgi:signal transduction histidine kinase